MTRRTKTTKTTGREYLRVSVDRSGRQRSQAEQHAENLTAAPTLGIDRFGKPYEDTGSASKHARTKRDDFARLLADLGAGMFGADVLVLWESSRGSRKVGEWVELIELCEKAGVKIAVTTHSRTYTPSNPRDRRSLLEDAVDSEYESSKTSGRVQRSLAALAVDGKPHGRIPFGYTRRYDPVTKRLIAQESHPTESTLVVEMFERVAAGHSLTAIAKDLAARGIVTRSGAAFHAQTIRSMLLRPVYRGRRVYSPGRQDDRPPRGHADKEYDGQWPALVSDATFLTVRQRLLDPARLTTRPGGTKHLLTTITCCDVCGGAMGARYRHGVRRYQCKDAGCVEVDADLLDECIEAELLGVLTRPDVLQRLMPAAVDDRALAAARDEVARIRAQHDDLIAQVANGKLTATLAARAEPGIVARLEVAERTVNGLATPAGLDQLIAPGPQMVERWHALPIEAQREVVRLLFVPGLLGAVTIARADGRRGLVRERVRLDGKTLR
jgi:site-specific DNA recombinase